MVVVTMLVEEDMVVLELSQETLDMVVLELSQETVDMMAEQIMQQILLSTTSH